MPQSVTKDDPPSVDVKWRGHTTQDYQEGYNDWKREEYNGLTQWLMGDMEVALQVYISNSF